MLTRRNEYGSATNAVWLVEGKDGVRVKGVGNKQKEEFKQRRGRVKVEVTMRYADKDVN